MPDFSFDLIARQAELSALVEQLGPAAESVAATAITAAAAAAVSAVALDIETVNWWDPDAEQISLIQLAFRLPPAPPRVAVIDALAAGLDLEPLRAPLESGAVVKALHNASFDAPRLWRHLGIRTDPVHDTMLAARRAGERRYSLQAQAYAHLGMRLDKSEQFGDWGARPLSRSQLRYAAKDAFCTLLLYEHQLARGLGGRFRLRVRDSQSTQTPLPLAPDAPPPPPASALTRDLPTALPPLTPPIAADVPEIFVTDAPKVNAPLSTPALALLGVVSECGGRYSPERLAASTSSDERVGLAGWTIDRVLGAEADLDESTTKAEIGALLQSGLIAINDERRLEVTAEGAGRWRQLRPK